MLRKLFAALPLLFAATAALAAVDVNKADQAQLEQVKGIGPALSQRILDERGNGPFKDWSDLVRRIGGVGPGNAARFSAAGLTVDGKAYAAGPAAAGSSAGRAPARDARSTTAGDGPRTGRRVPAAASADAPSGPAAGSSPAGTSTTAKPVAPADDGPRTGRRIPAAASAAASSGAVRR